MSDISFQETLTYSAAGQTGRITAESGKIVFSSPAGMGGKGEGTNPEELLLAAVSSCFTLTLSLVLRGAKLPYTDLSISADGAVTGIGTRDLKYARITVTPTIIGADVARSADYDAACAKAHDRCFIGATLKGNVEYVVGAVTLA